MTLLAVGLAGSLVSCSKDTGPDSGNQEVGTLKTTITFAEAPGTKAGMTTAVPVTGWSKINQVQLFLYDVTTGAVKYSDVKTTITNDDRTLTWTDVPTGDYILAVVANANGNVATSLDGGVTFPANGWDKYNVREKSVTSDAGLYITHKEYTTVLPTDLVIPTTADAKMEPAEIFTGYAGDVTAPIEITSGGEVDLRGTPIALTREMALMRVRLNLGTNNDLLEFDHANASIMIHRLPSGMKIGKDDDGGIAGNSQPADIMVVATGANTFSEQAPTDGYENGNSMLGNGYTMWRDIVVFPNNGGRVNDATTNAPAAPADAYYIVLSAHAPKDHVLADGTVIGEGGKTIFWDGLIRDAFVPNNIREVNLTLKSGGSLDKPTEPTEEGSMKVTIGAPLPWNTAIEKTDIEI